MDAEAAAQMCSLSQTFRRVRASGWMSTPTPSQGPETAEDSEARWVAWELPRPTPSNPNMGLPEPKFLSLALTETPYCYRVSSEENRPPLATCQRACGVQAWASSLSWWYSALLG